MGSVHKRRFRLATWQGLKIESEGTNLTDFLSRSAIFKMLRQFCPASLISEGSKSFFTWRRFRVSCIPTKKSSCFWMEETSMKPELLEDAPLKFSTPPFISYCWAFSTAIMNRASRMRSESEPDREKWKSGLAWVPTCRAWWISAPKFMVDKFFVRETV